MPEYKAFDYTFHVPQYKFRMSGAPVDAAGVGAGASATPHAAPHTNGSYWNGRGGGHHYYINHGRRCGGRFGTLVVGGILGAVAMNCWWKKHTNPAAYPSWNYGPAFNPYQQPVPSQQQNPQNPASNTNNNGSS